MVAQMTQQGFTPAKSKKEKVGKSIRAYPHSAREGETNFVVFS